jgi:hypothetical protein
MSFCSAVEAVSFGILRWEIHWLVRENVQMIIDYYFVEDITDWSKVELS